MTTAGEAQAAMRSFPVLPLAELLDAGPMLILAPHPDDESLGCGGLIAAASEAGQPPFVLVMTDGAGSHPRSRDYPPARLRDVRALEARAAVAALGLPPERIGFLGLPDTDSPVGGTRFDAAVAAVAAMARQHGIRQVLTSWEHDPHHDHVAAHGIGVAVAAALAARLLAYPVWGWTLAPEHALPGAVPRGWRLDVAGWLPRKRRAIQAHRSQYAGLITDDPEGFQLPADFVALFDGHYETILAG